MLRVLMASLVLAGCAGTLAAPAPGACDADWHAPPLPAGLLDAPERKMDMAQLEAGAARGDERAVMELAHRLRGNSHVPKDLPRAAALYLQAAEAGSATGQVNLGAMYLDGLGVARDPVKVEYWWRKSAEQGAPSNQYNFAHGFLSNYYGRQDDAEAARWLQQAADQNLAVAQWMLGVMHARGRGVSQSTTEAVRWYRRAAEQGESDAQVEMGDAYESGVGVTADREQATQWFRKAALQAHPRGMYEMSRKYREAPDANATEAATCARKAAARGIREAQFDLGVMYLRGYGVAPSEAKAFEWVRKSADAGLEYAQSPLGDLYNAGTGVARNARSAAFWYQQAARRGDASGQRKFAGVLQETDSGSARLPIAYAWLLLAETGGDTEASAARRTLVRRLSPEQLAQAVQWAAEWKPGTLLGGLVFIGATGASLEARPPR